MSATMKILATMLFAALTLSACAQAQTAQDLTPSAIRHGQVAADEGLSLVKDSKIRFGQLSGVPSGYYDMCVSRPDLCRVRGGRLAATRDGSVVFTSATMDQLNAVNAQVNATIHPAYRDAWTPEQPVGDCKDFDDQATAAHQLGLAVVRAARGDRADIRWGTAFGSGRAHQPGRFRSRQFDERDLALAERLLFVGENSVDDRRLGLARHENVGRLIAGSTARRRNSRAGGFPERT